tara:strand:- start:493 stop:645 length:153 start_codon:yes stop_codon:yes gene_type:complete
MCFNDVARHLNILHLETTNIAEKIMIYVETVKVTLEWEEFEQMPNVRDQR